MSKRRNPAVNFHIKLICLVALWPNFHKFLGSWDLVGLGIGRNLDVGRLVSVVLHEFLVCVCFIKYVDKVKIAVTVAILAQGTHWAVASSHQDWLLSRGFNSCLGFVSFPRCCVHSFAACRLQKYIINFKNNDEKNFQAAGMCIYFYFYGWRIRDDIHLRVLLARALLGCRHDADIGLVFGNLWWSSLTLCSIIVMAP